MRYIDTLKGPVSSGTNFPSYNPNWNRFQKTKLPTEGKFCNCVLPDIDHLHRSISNGGDALAFYSLTKAVRGCCSNYCRSDGKLGKVDTERTPSERTPFPMD